MQQGTNQVRAASSFATLARSGQPTDRCGYCGGFGDGGQMVYVGGYHIPHCHSSCKVEIESQDCCCYEFQGDNSGCPVHGDDHVH
jgi:hypothetical protein